jgi:hypothetical protein
MTNPVQPVIVVKKKGGHAAHHGGAWKVAYADFVTAMMAFFLVMWLVNQSKPVKAAIGGYFRDPAAFEASGGRGVLPGGDTVNPPKPETPAAEQEERKRMEAAVLHIREGLDKDAFASLRDQVEFTITPEGLRIDLIDKDDSTFFDSGSAALHGETEPRGFDLRAAAVGLPVAGSPHPPLASQSGPADLGHLIQRGQQSPRNRFGAELLTNADRRGFGFGAERRRIGGKLSGSAIPCSRITPK